MRTFLAYWYYKIFKSSGTFRWNGKEYCYFYHWYNFTWRNERAIEIALFLEAVKNNRKLRILEVGNVLSHYVPISHDVVDKYEKANGVINEDIVSYKQKKPYDLIISISTIEHVGFDEAPLEPMKFVRVFIHLQSLLTHSGKLMVSLPLGYNPYIDSFLAKNRSGLKIDFLKRISKENVWRQVDWNSIKGILYNHPFPNANGIAIMVLKKTTSLSPT